MMEFISKFNLFVEKALPCWMFFLLVNNIVYCEGYNYCYGDAEKTLCGSNQHFMCHDNLLPGGEGNYITNVPMTKKLKLKILKMHNEYRNKVASGTETGKGGVKFPPAARMREILWDKELEYSAKRHADQCSFNHDKCHNTVRFPFSGQNLGKGHISNEIHIDEILAVLNSMYDEKNDIEKPEELPKAFLKEFLNCGHFTVMSNERTSFVGCGLTFCQHPGQDTKFYMLSCNYEFTNMVNNAIYTTGEPASKCSDWETGKSGDYEHLCKNNGKIYPYKH